MFSHNLRTAHAVRHSFLAIILGAAAGLVHAERLPIRQYTTADGLWSSAITYVMRDSHGFIWLCSRDGLSRFDGYGFVNYRLRGVPASDHVQNLFETSKGAYWMVTSDGGVYYFDPKGINPADTVESNSLDDGRRIINAELIATHHEGGSFIEDRQGNLFLAAEGLFAARQLNGKTEFTPLELNLAANSWKGFFVYAVCEDSHGDLWLGTNHGLLRRSADGRVEHFFTQHKDADVVHSLLIDKDGFLWIGNRTGLYVLKPAAFPASPGKFVSHPLNARQPATSVSVLPEKAGEAIDHSMLIGRDNMDRARSILVAGIYQASDGRVWIAFFNRLAAFDGQRFVLHTPGEGLTEYALGSFAEDAEGDLWIATINGPARLSVQGIKSYDRKDGLGEASVQNILEGPDGHLNVITSNWLINRFDGLSFKAIRPNLPADATYSWRSTVAFVDHLGEWWFPVNRQGLYRFAHVKHVEELAQRQPTAVYTEQSGLKSNYLFCLFEDSRGDLWISTRDNRSATDRAGDGLTRWQRSSDTLHTFSEAEGFPPGRAASSFAEDKSGDLWFGFYLGGLARYAQGQFTVFGSADGLPEGTITDLHVDRVGRLWISSGSGLVRVDDPSAINPLLRTYTTKDGLASNTLRCITEDAEGHIYIGTVRGVDRLTPETGHITHYTVSDGLIGDFVESSYRDRNGTLWFGTFNGLSRLDPKPDRAPALPTIFINALQIAGVARPLSEFGESLLEGLELNPTQNDLQITYSSSSITRASVRYQYMLEGADRDWGAPTDLRTVVYARLTPGRYRFLVRAVNADGVSKTPATVSFTILPPVWRRWWFMVLASLFIFGAASWIERYRALRRRERHESADALRHSREERLRELERVRKRIAGDLHDDIGSSLTKISLLSEVLRRRIDHSDASVQAPLEMIGDSSRDLLDTMSDIVWATNPQKDHLSDLSRRMRRLASDLFTLADISFSFAAPADESDMVLGANLRREVFLIFGSVLI